MVQEPGICRSEVDVGGLFCRYPVGQTWRNNTRLGTEGQGMSVLFSSVWVRVYTQHHIYGWIWYSSTYEIIYYKDSPPGKTKIVRESLRALHKELEFPGQPNSHLLSFQRVASQCFFPLSGSCCSYDLIFKFIYLSLGLHSLPLCYGFVQMKPFSCVWNALVELIHIYITMWGIQSAVKAESVVLISLVRLLTFFFLAAGIDER